MNEKQVLMTISDVWGFFSRNHIPEGGFAFQWGGIWFLVEGQDFIFKKNHRIGRGGAAMIYLYYWL